MSAVEAGATLLHAPWSRAWIDLNRDPTELDETEIDDVPTDRPLRHSVRVQAGLGVVPTVLFGHRLHRQRPTFTEVAERIATVHERYHQAVRDELGRLSATFGQAVLLDCHSMPGTAPNSPALADVVLGDRFGRSCGSNLVVAVEQAIRDHGLSLARNHPFAGGWITERHGHPARGIHALQIEVRRDLFLPETADNLSTRKRIKALAQELVRRLADLVSRAPDCDVAAAE